MNTIDATITTVDRQDAKRKRKSAATYAEEILEHLRTAQPHGVTFVHEISTVDKRIIEAQLKAAFEQWANSWIAPLCREIIAKEIR